MRTLHRVHARGARSGGSLIEVLVVIAVLALLIGIAGFAMTRSRGAYDQGMVSADVEVQARRCLDRIATDLLSASAASIRVDDLAPPAPANAVTWLDFRPVTGFAGGAVTDPQHRLRLVLDPAEADNGADDNGNGLVDECRLELQTDVVGSPQAVGLVSGVRRLAEGEFANGIDDNGDGRVDEPGFNVVWEPTQSGATGERGGRLRMQLTLVRRVRGGRLVTRTVTTTVRVRSL